MGYMTFSDGMEFNLSGMLRTEHRSDGWYVVGEGMLIPVKDREEGQAYIKDFYKNKNNTTTK